MTRFQQRQKARREFKMEKRKSDQAYKLEKMRIKQGAKTDRTKIRNDASVAKKDSSNNRRVAMNKDDEATSQYAYSVGMDPNAYKADIAKSVMGGVSSLGSSISGIFGGGGGQMPQEQYPIDNLLGDTGGKSSKLPLILGGIGLLVVLVIGFVFMSKKKK